EPPEVVVAPGVERCDRMAVVVDGLRADEAVAFRVRQRLDGPVESLPCKPIIITRAPPQTRAPEPALGLGGAEVAPVHGNCGCARHWAIPHSPSALHVLG